MLPDLLGLLPAYFKDVLDFQEIMNTEALELLEFERCLQRVYDNLYIQTADTSIIGYHESLFGVMASPTESLEYRRLRILNRYNNVTPLTMVTLRERLNQLVGFGNYEVIMDHANYLLTVKIWRGTLGIADEVANSLIFIVPAHIEQSIEQPLEAVCTTSVIMAGGQGATMICTMFEEAGG